MAPLLDDAARVAFRHTLLTLPSANRPATSETPCAVDEPVAMATEAAAVAAALAALAALAARAIWDHCHRKLASALQLSPASHRPKAPCLAQPPPRHQPHCAVWRPRHSECTPRQPGCRRRRHDGRDRRCRRRRRQCRRPQSSHLRQSARASPHNSARYSYSRDSTRAPLLPNRVRRSPPRSSRSALPSNGADSGSVAHGEKLSTSEGARDTTRGTLDFQSSCVRIHARAPTCLVRAQSARHARRARRPHEEARRQRWAGQVRIRSHATKWRRVAKSTRRSTWPCACGHAFVESAHAQLTQLAAALALRRLWLSPW